MGYSGVREQLKNALELCDLIGILASQVGLEPTTLRLTARNPLFTQLLRIALCHPFSAAYEDLGLA
jgi:hypothetical protein